MSPIRINNPKKLAIICAGQSNADGRVPANQLPSYITLPIENCHFCNTPDGVFRPLGSHYYSNGRWAFDLVTYHYVTQVDKQELFVIKKAMGGTSIDPTGDGRYHWTIDFDSLPDTSLSLLRSFEDIIRACMMSRGQDFTIKAMLWHQGESDRAAYSPVAAEHYYDNLKRLIAYCRGIVGDMSLPFVCGTVPHISGQYDETVDHAIRKLASEDSHMYLIDLADAQLLDHYHMNAAWSEYFGKMAHDALIDAGVIHVNKINPMKPHST